jgi:hypothetical protein
MKLFDDSSINEIETECMKRLKLLFKKAIDQNGFVQEEALRDFVQSLVPLFAKCLAKEFEEIEKENQNDL